ncbi:MAG: lipoyl(octanoyl) transferase LipB, partial [Candidatus Cloacimonetes bacterium]|nr:lipoyl(octanoyl) transferase LipB [Candidatus Cloacimonadota bacterium]
GGDVTYHDPGQIVGYLILSLKPNERDLHKVLFGLEEVILLSLQELGIPGHRVEGKTGVFVNNQKVCSIGIACRHWITYHGFALNIHSDLKNYQRINPCGLESSLMQNITITNEQETFLKAKLFQYATSIFGRESLKNGSTSIKGFLQTCSIIAPA